MTLGARPHGSRRLALLFASFLLGAPGVAFAQSGHIRWNKVDVVARLDGNGVVEVEETHDVMVNADVTLFLRSLNFAADQKAVVHGVERFDPLGVRTPLKNAPGNEALSYQSYAWGLQIVLRGEKDPWFAEGTRHRYVITYQLTNALAPAWDIHAGLEPLERDTRPRNPIERLGETLIFWNSARTDLDRLYVFDHDVVFPAAEYGGSVPELSYRFEYDKAWELLDPGRPVGVAIQDVDYRVQRVLKYLPPGKPSAVDPTFAAYRVASAFGPVLVGLVLTVLFLIADRVLRRGPRGDRELFEKRIGAVNPSLVAAAAGVKRQAPDFHALVLRLAARKRISISVEPPDDDDNPPAVQLRLSGNRDSLDPFERDALSRVFGLSDTLATADIQKGNKGKSFVPDLILRDSFQKFVPVRPVRLKRPFLNALHFLLLIAGVVTMIRSLALQTFPDPVPLVVSLIPGISLAGIWPVGGPARRLKAFWVLFGVALVGLTAFLVPFFPNRPPDGLTSLGALLVGIAHCVGYLKRIPRASASDLELGAARDWALAELKRPRPALRDEWIESLQAIEGERAISRWKRKYGGNFGGAVDMAEMQLGDLNSGPPFTGDAPQPPKLPFDWVDGFTRGDDLDDDEEEEDDGEKGAGGDGGSSSD